MIGDYLKQAAAQLRRAALARKDETSTMRRDMNNRESELKRMADNLRTIIDQRKREINSTNDAALRSERTAEITRLEQEIKTMQNDFDHEKTRINQELQWKENQINTLNNQAVDFERQAGMG